MKILVIDRDKLASQMIRSKLEAQGHEVVEEPVKNNAIEKLQHTDFDCVIFDPAPLNNARPIVLSIRRAARNYPYVTLMSQTLDTEEALKSGANDIMNKPIDGEKLLEGAKNAQRLTRLIRRIGDESEDFPSAGGVIAKSAFNQLFLSGIDRADRYGEQSFLVFIGINNAQEMLELDGSYALEYATAKLSQYLVKLRRQSDIIAQTGRSEYCLMLQRPQYETEPMEAANRFGHALGQFDDLYKDEAANTEIYVRLINIPVGKQHIEHLISAQSRAAQKAGA